MTDVQIMAGTLTASAEDRVVSGLLVPYGEVGRTNLGKFEVPPGTLNLPTDLSTCLANLDHEREQPAASALTLTDTPGGVVASFRVAKNKQGDTLLAEIADPSNPKARRNLSAEIANVVIRAGKMVSGDLFGGAFVERGAFPSATLLAADVGEEDDPEDTPSAEATTTTEKTSREVTREDGSVYIENTETTTVVDGDKTTVTNVVTMEDKPSEQGGTEEDDMGAKAPTGLFKATDAAKAGPTFAQIMRGVHQVRHGHADDTVLAMLRGNAGPGAATLFAALNDVKYDADAKNPAQAINPFPQWVGELWDGLTFERDVIDLLDGPKALTAATIAGWKWETKPSGGDWAGNKTAVPSNTPTAVPYESGTDYFAGAHDHANEYRHFPNETYWTSYYEAMRESYGRWSNDKALGYLNDAATALEGDAAPAGLALGLSLLVDGAVEVVANDALPTFALIEPALYKGMLKSTQNNVLGYLSAALGFQEGDLQGFKIRPKKGQVGVTVGAREAVSFYELPGVPLRIEAEDLTKGGLDTGLFGYVGHVVHKEDAVQHVYAKGTLPSGS